jgi:hypothetical protein
VALARTVGDDPHEMGTLRQVEASERIECSGIPREDWDEAFAVNERLLRRAVPPHRPHRVPPATLHLLVRRPVDDVTGADRLAEMPVLRLDDVVGGRPAECCVARATQLAAGHGPHLHLLVVSAHRAEDDALEPVHVPMTDQGRGM